MRLSTRFFLPLLQWSSGLQRSEGTSILQAQWDCSFKCEGEQDDRIDTFH